MMLEPCNARAPNCSPVAPSYIGTLGERMLDRIPSISGAIALSVGGVKGLVG
jgi:hypothetical protein